jgi:hypothetical protein
MCLGEDSRLLPHVFLCGTKDTAQMTPIAETASDNLLSYQLKDSDLGNICKVRLKTDNKSLLKMADDAPESNGQPAVVYIRKVSECFRMFNIYYWVKMRLSDNANGDEIRFPSADVEMDHDSIVEFPAFWPDRPPLPSEFYWGILLIFRLFWDFSLAS